MYQYVYKDLKTGLFEVITDLIPFFQITIRTDLARLSDEA